MPVGGNLIRFETSDFNLMLSADSEQTVPDSDPFTSETWRGRTWLVTFAIRDQRFSRAFFESIKGSAETFDVISLCSSSKLFTAQTTSIFFCCQQLCVVQTAMLPVCSTYWRTFTRLYSIQDETELWLIFSLISGSSLLHLTLWSFFTVFIISQDPCAIIVSLTLVKYIQPLGIEGLGAETACLYDAETDSESASVRFEVSAALHSP